MKREINYRMSTLILRYENEYASKKRSWIREKSILNGIQAQLGDLFVREVADGVAIQRWYRSLMDASNLSAGTAARHFNVMHHMMAKASKIWSRETGIDRNPADLVEVQRPNDQRSVISRLKKSEL